jgi:enamine deaminase RidA (YjgF/YER057c/UK114 family)
MVGTGDSPSVSAEQRLKELGIDLPTPPKPLGVYVETVQSGRLLFLSGMLPVVNHKPKYVGRLGKELDAESGRDALYMASMNALSAARAHLGTLDKVTRIVRLGIYWQRLVISSSIHTSPMPLPSSSKASLGKRRPQSAWYLVLRAYR